MDGFINVYKEEGMSSHDVVSKIRRALNFKKVGHAGTLDPMARGVLPISLGRAGRLIEYLHEDDKEYRGSFVLGYETDSLDRTGNIIKESPVTYIEPELIREKFLEFRGPYMQKVPMYSAVKINGKKLYEYARAGIEVERPARLVNIYSLQCLETDGNKVSFVCACSKGTYIRQLVSDIAISLGSLACLTSLERTAVGPFKKKDSLAISKLEDMDREEIEKYIIRPDFALTSMSRMDLDENKAYRAKCGQIIDRMEAFDDGLYKVYREDSFIGIGKVHQGKLKMEKVFL